MYTTDQIIPQTHPTCPSCGNLLEPCTNWFGINFCRGLTLLKWVEDEPGLSGWELSEQIQMPFPDVTKGLAKLRKHGVVQTETEDRIEGGGFRYRYWASSNVAVGQRFIESVRSAEALNGL